MNCPVASDFAIFLRRENVVESTLWLSRVIGLRVNHPLFCRLCLLLELNVTPYVDMQQAS